jgi:hypothetical protein
MVNAPPTPHLFISSRGEENLLLWVARGQKPSATLSFTPYPPTLTDVFLISPNILTNRYSQIPVFKQGLSPKVLIQRMMYRGAQPL